MTLYRHESKVIRSPQYANVPPTSYWPALSQYASRGGYKTKITADTTAMLQGPCVHMNTSFFVSPQCQLLAKPFDYTTTETTYPPPGNRKSCGMRMSGYSCCLSWWGETDRVWSLQNSQLGEEQNLTILLWLLSRKHRSIYNVNIRRKERGHDLLFSMINESINCYVML